MLGFLLGGFRFLAVSEPDKYTIQLPRVSAVGFLLTKLAVQFANANIGITAMVVPDPGQFFLCMRVWMLAVGPM